MPALTAQQFVTRDHAASLTPDQQLEMYEAYAAGPQARRAHVGPAPPGQGRISHLGHGPGGLPGRRGLCDGARQGLAAPLLPRHGLRAGSRHDPAPPHAGAVRQGGRPQFGRPPDARPFRLRAQPHRLRLQPGRHSDARRPPASPLRPSCAGWTRSCSSAWARAARARAIFTRRSTGPASTTCRSSRWCRTTSTPFPCRSRSRCPCRTWPTAATHTACPA